jgi:hypothetical protein
MSADPPAEPAEPAAEPEDAPDDVRSVSGLRGVLARAYSYRVVRMGLVGVIIVAVLASWAGHESTKNEPTTPSDAAVDAKAAQPADIDKVAAAAGCSATPTTSNSTYKQAFCVAGPNRLTITTFTTEADQKAWLAEALPYGGSYLIGQRWVVGANTADGMNRIADTLGGSIVEGGKHG